MQTTIMALSVDARNLHAPEVQTVLTRYGSIIKTRLGLHEVAVDSSSQVGRILLHICSDSNEVNSLEEELTDIEGVNVKHMTL
ncbi:hypothetical protein HBE96_10620 [Clostridium sp. P21]|uniref:Iron-only hydrogenase system regulator n=1 Tax=Clostridium muellerianum TaxID=2716538 RepID=A0A7Y0EGU2_9CLOT|nr:hypothetical protein [Clostridium muellerianum]NMM63141.1 hypothetical protein [Clostridium muellerianum]